MGSRILNALCVDSVFRTVSENLSIYLTPLGHFRFTLEPFTGLYTDTTDIMAEMEGFGKGSQLFVTSKMIEIFLTYSAIAPAGQTDRQSRQEPQSFKDGELITRGRSVRMVTRRIRDPNCSLTRRLFRPIHPNPASPGHMFMGEMAFLGFPIHNLGGRDGHRLISKVLNR